MKRLLLIGLIVGAFGVNTATAGPIAYAFSGLIGRTDTPDVTVGDLFTGTFLYDPAAPISGSAGLNGSTFVCASCSISVTLNGVTYQTNTPDWPSANISVTYSNFLFPDGTYGSLILGNSMTPTGAFPSGPAGILLQFMDAQASVFSYPVSALPSSFGAFEYIQLSMFGDDPNSAGYYNANGLVTSLQPVPDPGSSLLLLGIGLVGLRACRKRWQ